MRVLWLTPGFAADENDHNCIPPLQLLARELVRQGVDLSIIALEYPFHAQPYRWHGIPVCPCDGRNRRWLKWRTLARARAFGKAWVAPPSPPEGGRGASPLVFPNNLGRAPIPPLGGLGAAIHAFWLGWAARAGAQMAQKNQLPHWITLMGQDVLPTNARHLKRLRSGDENRLVALSDFQHAALEKTLGFRAGHTIPWGVDEGEIPSILPEQRPLDVLGVGSLLPVKNWTDWLRVIRRGVDKKPDLRAELVGDGPERGKLERLARELGLEKNLRFVGNLSRPAVLEKMQTAQVLLHTAHFESFGFVLAEAAMCGCRVVSTPVGIAPAFELVGHDEAILTEKLLYALDLPLLGAPRTPFTMPATAAAYLDLYRSGLAVTGNAGVE